MNIFKNTNLRKLLQGITATLVASLIFLSCGAADRDDTHDPMPNFGLATQMHFVQVWTHKLGLSIEAKNLELADFYHHELEEAIEEIIATIQEYDGFPIARLTESMLVPAMDALEDAIEALEELGESAPATEWNQGWLVARTRYEALILSCNQCHTATDHGFIKITTGFGKNPFNQEF